MNADNESAPSGGAMSSRRSALRTAGLAAGAAWTVPVVQVVAMDSAQGASGAPWDTGGGRGGDGGGRGGGGRR
jgi:hypothetical protein